jgi:hypothetical protein
MDSSRFDAITTALYRASGRRALLAAMTVSLLGGGVAEGKNKKKKKKNKKKSNLPPSPPPPDCVPSCAGKTCGDNGCGGSCGNCGGDKQCQHGNCICEPESQITTCAARCGTWPNNCEQDITCPSCPVGKECLINGSCGIPCNGDTCSAGCGCSGPNTEGDRFCLAFLGDCPARECSSTFPCPPGTMCHDTGVGGCPGRFVCWPLCPA